MAAEWVMDELRGADLKDQRLNNRLREVLSQLSDRPTASIPAACGGHAEMTAAYRLFDNEKVTFEKILKAHQEATHGRIAGQPVVLLVQDTSEVDLSRPGEQVQGVGPLDGGTRWGALLHLVHAFTPDGTPLGTVHAEHWVRDAEAAPASSLTRAQRGRATIEEKESYRWLTGFNQVRAIAGSCAASRCVCLADSEADIYEYLAEATHAPKGPDWIVRACQNRALERDSSALGQRHLREELLGQKVLPKAIRSPRPPNTLDRPPADARLRPLLETIRTNKTLKTTTCVVQRGRCPTLRLCPKNELKPLALRLAQQCSDSRLANFLGKAPGYADAALRPIGECEHVR